MTFRLFLILRLLVAGAGVGVWFGVDGAGAVVAIIVQGEAEILIDIHYPLLMGGSGDDLLGSAGRHQKTVTSLLEQMIILGLGHLEPSL